MPSIVIIVGGALALAGVIFGIVFAFRGEEETSQDHLRLARAADAQADATTAEAEAVDPSPLISRYLDRLGLTKRVQWHLLRAGLLVRPSEFIALALGAAAMGFTVGFMVKGLPLGIVMGGFGLAMPVMYINARKAMRAKALIAQLAEALSMMASSLRSGYSFMRAMQVIRDEMDAPISEEFGRVLDELNVGVSQDRALGHLLDRCPSPDIDLVVTACQIQANVGGNLAQILDTTAEMIRERTRLQGEIAALTAEGRLSAGILGALPIALAVVVSHMVPGYLDPLTQTKIGMLMLGGASGAMMLGLVVIKKMMDVQI